MAQKTQMVTISLEEYKELLLKDKPQSDNDSVLMERLLENIVPNLKYSENDYYSNYIGDNMKLEKEEKIIVDFMKSLKYQNFDKYMEIWNRVQSNHRKEEEMKLKMEQMNKAKEIRTKEGGK
ncbi:hypothetical protein LJC02_02915 [Breznakia sp. OttesenSCG-928-G09]|nr:hypothetical protein [Breznakia sp. OttesenSCG-928-G09]